MVIHSLRNMAFSKTEPEDEMEVTSRIVLEATLRGVANGRISVVGFEEGDLQSLDGIVLPLSGPPDGSLKKGDVISFGENCRAEVKDVGTAETDGHVFYQVKLYTR